MSLRLACRQTDSGVKIGLIGPVFPWRGGIAQYTTMLHRALGQRRKLKTISFKSQYPSWLYPGKSTLEPGYEKHREPGVKYGITPFNPISWARACQEFVKNNVDCVIISWWTIFWGPCFWFILKYLRGYKIDVIFLCHNIAEHETSIWKMFFTRQILAGTDSFIVHSRAQGKVLKKLIGKAKVLVHPLPVFRHFDKCGMELPRKAGLELLFLGFVREYKGLDILADAMELLRDEDLHLSVVGEWWLDDKRLYQRLKDMVQVEVVDRYVAERELYSYLCRADVVVIPYRTVSGSAILPCAFLKGKPVIVTRLEGLAELVDDGVTGRIVPPENPNALARAIREFLNGSIRVEKGAIYRSARQMSWEALADSIMTFLDNRPMAKQFESG